MKKSTGVILILIIVLLLGVIGVGGYFLIKGNNDTNKEIGNLKNEVANIGKSTENTSNNQVINDTTLMNKSSNMYNNTQSNNSNTTENTGTTTNSNTSSISINGKYEFKQQNENYYHESSVEISDQSDTSINFSINAVHGRNVDTVNIGEISGKANKIDIPQDCIVPNSTQYAYQFVENRDGNTYKITLVYTAHKMFEYVIIKEDYSNGINPYAGHNVNFAGDYEKIQ